MIGKEKNNCVKEIEVVYIPCLFEEKKIRFKTRNLTPISIFLSLIRKYPEVRKDALNISIRVNGRKISLKEWRKKLNPGDKVLINQEIGYAFSAGLVFWISSALSVSTSTAFTIASVLYTAFNIFTIASTIYSVVSTFMSGPSYGSKTTTPGNAPDASATYGWDGIRLQSNAGIPIPIVYGEHFTGGYFVCVTTSE
jgi:predicted phage tail protein